jgi:hypothetical protein
MHTRLARSRFMYLALRGTRAWWRRAARYGYQVVCTAFKTMFPTGKSPDRYFEVLQMVDYELHNV